MLRAVEGLRYSVWRAQMGLASQTGGGSMFTSLLLLIGVVNIEMFQGRASVEEHPIPSVTARNDIVPLGQAVSRCAMGLLSRENTLQYQAHSAETQDLASPRQMGWSGCRDARSCVSTKAHPEKRIIAGDLASHSRYIVMRHLGVIMSLLQGPPRSNSGEERHRTRRVSNLLVCDNNR